MMTKGYIEGKCTSKISVQGHIQPLNEYNKSYYTHLVAQCALAQVQVSWRSFGHTVKVGTIMVGTLTSSG